jgi:hypothetical protein
MAMGRPTKYDPAFCDVVIELGKQGASKVEMACKLGISRDSFDVYEKTHPGFSEAVKEAVAYSQAWWEEKGRNATFGRVDNFNATSFIFNMKNRFPKDWKDNKQLDHTSSDRSMSPASASDAALLEVALGDK